MRKLNFYTGNKDDIDQELLKELNDDLLAYNIYVSITQTGFTSKIVKDAIIFAEEKKGNIGFFEKYDFYNKELIPYLLDRKYSHEEINEFLTLFSEVYVGTVLLNKCLNVEGENPENYIKNYAIANRKYGDQLDYVFILLSLLFVNSDEAHSKIFVDQLYKVGINELTEMTLAEKERNFIKPVYEKVDNIKEIRSLIVNACSSYSLYKEMCGLKFDDNTLKTELIEALDFIS